MMGISFDMTARGTDRAPSGPSLLLADPLPPGWTARLEELGCAVSEADGECTDLSAAITLVDPKILVVRSTPIDRRVLDASRSLSLVVRAGAGVDNIDVQAASARGIFVASCPGKNAVAVAELTWGLILACDRRIVDQTLDLRAGRWKKRQYAACSGLFGRTLGIVGLGRIGREVALRAKAFGMRVLAWSRSLSAEQALELDVGRCEHLVDLARSSDVVSVHVAACGDTRHLINRRFFEAMKPGACFVNTSRGSVVEPVALNRAVRKKGIVVGLDVFSEQPKPDDEIFKDPIVAEDGVYGTHHNGASTDQAQDAVAGESVRIVQHYLQTGDVLNCVNRSEPSAAQSLLTVRHENRPGVLAGVFAVIGASGINVEDMENVICQGGDAACARLRLSEMPSSEDLAALTAHPSVIAISLLPRARPPGS